MLPLAFFNGFITCAIRSDDDDNDLLKALDRAATSGHKSNGRAKWSSDEEA
jgi:hypothetical protein